MGPVREKVRFRGFRIREFVQSAPNIDNEFNTCSVYRGFQITEDSDKRGFTVTVLILHKYKVIIRLVCSLKSFYHPHNYSVYTTGWVHALTKGLLSVVRNTARALHVEGSSTNLTNHSKVYITAPCHYAFTICLITRNLSLHTGKGTQLKGQARVFVMVCNA